MTQDEIIEMARQAGFKMENSAAIQAAETFAALVAAKERRACAKVCAEVGAWTLVHEIEARGEAWLN